MNIITSNIEQVNIIHDEDADENCGDVGWDGLGEEFYQAERDYYDRKASEERMRGLESVSYPDNVAKYNLGGTLGDIVSWLNEYGHEKDAKGIAVCGSRTNAVDIRCNFGHRYAKQISCGRQYCPRCGEIGSVIHQRRYSRSWDRLMWAPALGTVILTVPEELRDDFKDIDMLGKLHKLGYKCVEEVLDGAVTENGKLTVDGAMTTVHLFGDKSDKFHPHVNILFPLCPDVEELMDENGWVSKEAKKAMTVTKETLKALREHWYNMLEELTGKTISRTEDGHKRANARYDYKVQETKKAFRLRYMLRPTVGAERFLRLDDSMKDIIATSLTGFHNVRWYGRLSNRTYRNYLENIPAYQEFLASKGKKERDFRYCPICHTRLKVTKRGDKVEILEGIHRTWFEIGDGFWCDEPTYKILIRKGLIGANGKLVDILCEGDVSNEK